MNSEIKKLDINLIRPDDGLKELYEKEKSDWIQEFSIESTFWGTRYNHQKGEDSWNSLYKNFNDWKIKTQDLALTPYGNQRIIDKINEIIDFLNKKK